MPFLSGSLLLSQFEQGGIPMLASIITTLLHAIRVFFVALSQIPIAMILGLLQRFLLHVPGYFDSQLFSSVERSVFWLHKS